MGKVSIILLNYTGKEYNQWCIDSILAQTYIDYEIIFVDNKSSDWSLEDVKKIYKDIIVSGKMKIIENKENYVFAQGNNIWVDHTSKDSKYICLLNNDVTLPSDWLKELVMGIESDDDLWWVSSLILDKWYEEELLNLHFKEKKVCVSNIFGESVLSNVSKKEIEEWIYYTSTLSGCCFLYKKNLIKHPFLDFYLIYAEDLYLSWFLLVKWYKLAVCTKSIVNHLGSATMWRNPSFFKLFNGNKNQIINFLIFYNSWTKIKLFPLFIITQLWHLAVNVPFKRLHAKYKAWIRIFRNRKKIKNAKKSINEQRKIDNKKFLELLSYKFSDNVSYGNFSKNKLRAIKIINILFKIYFKLINIHTKK